MKAEVLAEWRTRLADRTLITLPAGAVERLLDERLRLLEALTRARQFLEVDDCYSLAANARKQADAALALAHEP